MSTEAVLIAATVAQADSGTAISVCRVRARWVTTQGGPKRQNPRHDVRAGDSVQKKLALAGLDRVGQLRGDVEQVAHDAVIGDLEDGCLFVLVDGDDRLRRLHTGPVLDG